MSIPPWDVLYIINLAIVWGLGQEKKALRPIGKGSQEECGCASRDQGKRKEHIKIV